MNIETSSTNWVEPNQQNWFVPMSEDRTNPLLPKVDPKAMKRDAQAIEDQILTMAFKQATRTVKARTIILSFMAGMMTGMVLLGVILVVLLDKVGAP